jgi:hypothetical protein
MGAVVWPDASLRVRLGLAPSGDGAAADEVTLVVAATGVGQADGGAAGGADDSPSYPLATGYVLDDQGFLFPPGVSPAPTSSGEGRRGKAMGENGQSESNLG